MFKMIIAKSILLANFGYILAKPFFINIQIIAYTIEPQL